MQPQDPNSGQPLQPVQPGAPAPVQPPTQPQPAPQPPAAPPQSAPQAAPVAPQPAQAAPAAATTPELDEEYDDEDGQYEDDAAEPVDLTQPVNWDAKEYVHQEKNSVWFIMFGVIFVVLMAVAIFLMKSPTFAVLLVVIAGVILVFAKRPPRVMSYSLSDKGLHIGDTLHEFTEFRAFGIVHDGEEYSVMLIPTKRFMPGITVYFPEEAGEEIVDALGSRLPMQELHLDVIDRLVRKLRLG